MSVIFSNAGIYQEQFFGVSVSCLRSEYMTGHLYFEVGFRGPFNPGGEEIETLRDTIKSNSRWLGRRSAPPRWVHWHKGPLREEAMNINVKFTILIMTFLCLLWSVSVQPNEDLVTLCYYTYAPLLVNRYLCGTGISTFSSCYAGRVDIFPSENYSNEFEALTINISRLTLTEICGYE